MEYFKIRHIPFNGLYMDIMSNVTKAIQEQTFHTTTLIVAWITVSYAIETIVVANIVAI